jgi:hypothetical protein
MNSNPYHSPVRKFDRRFRVWSQEPSSLVAAVAGGGGLTVALLLLDRQVAALTVAVLASMLVFWMVHAAAIAQARRMVEFRDELQAEFRAQLQAALDRGLSRR